MKDPRRLLEGDASELELHLLGLAQREQAPSAAPQRLAAQLGLPVGMLGLEALGAGVEPVASAGPSVPPTALGAGAVKSVGLLHGVAGKLVLASVIGALGGGALYWGMPAEREVERTSAATSASTRTTMSTSTSTSASTSTSMAPSPRAAEVGVLDREVAELAKVRMELQAGRARDALDGLGGFERAHPTSVLMQEARALRVEALLVAHDSSAARAEGERFLRSYPDSPHRARVEALLRARHSLR